MSLPTIVEHVRRDGDPRTVLLVAGDGTLRGDLAMALADLRAGDRLLGHIPDVADLLVAADAIVLPSSAEGVPQVLVQAMAAGLPFAAYDVDGVGELLGLGASGCSVDLGDVDALGRACRRALERPRAPAPPAELLAQWSADEVGKRYRAAYERDVRAEVRTSR
jgi:glycosyltransferase involved in cell wall biosynthesis